VRFTSAALALTRRNISPVAYVFAAVLLVRVYALTKFTSSPLLLPRSGDMHFYNEWARRILDGQWTDHLAFYGLPLYAYLLAGIYRLVGYGPFVPGLLQAVLEAGTASLLFKIADRAFGRIPADPNTSRRWILQNPGRWIGCFAALGWAFFVPAQAYALVLMPTVWLVFVFWFLVWQIVRSDEMPSLLRTFVGGLLVGFTAMGVATILFLVPLLIIALCLRRDPDSRAIPRKAAAVALLLFGIGVGAAPCWIHNYFVARDPVFLSAHSGVNFWIGNNPIANGYPRFPPGLRAGQAAMLQDSISVAEAAAGRNLARSEVSHYWSEKAAKYIRENPARWLELLVTKVRNFWNAFQYDDLSIITNLRASGTILPGPGFGVVAALGLAGMFSAWRRYPRARWIAAAIFLHLASLLTVFVTERYRLAAVPGLFLFAAFGLWFLWENCSLGRYRLATVYATALAASTIFVSLPQKDPALWALDAYNSGWQALEANDLGLAEKKLLLARAYVPENAEINLALGNLRLAQGDRAAARNFYQETLRLDPAHAAALNNLGVLELQAGHWRSAAGMFRQALQRSPRNAKLHYFLAKAALGAADLSTAETEAAAALELAPTQPEFLALRDEIAEKRRGAELKD
jgi:Flp pilus assembly protein TadD